MADVNFAPYSNGAANTDVPVYSTGIGLPSSRAAANGSGACLISALYGYLSGNGSARTGSMALGSAATSGFSMAAAGSPNGTGWIGTNLWLVNGGTAQFTLYFYTGYYFGRGGGGIATDTDGYTWSGTVSGWYRYLYAPAAPAAPAVVANADPTKLDVTWVNPTDNGDTALTGSRIEWSTSPTFASGVSSATVAAGATTYQIAGLLPGTTYYVRVSAKNAVTDAQSTWGAYSGATQRTTLAGGKVRVSGAWKPRTRKIMVSGVWKPVTRRTRVSGAWKAVL